MLGYDGEMMHFLPLIGENYRAYTRRYPNILQIKSSNSSIESDDFSILFDNQIFRQPDDNLSWQNLPQRYDIMRGRGSPGAQGIPHQKPKSYQLQEVHEI